MSEPHIPEAPYKGLVPYAEEDAPFFFGRDAEREIITANLLASRLTVLYGASGVGKSSVLRAGVVHHLRRRAERDRAEHGRAEFAVAVLSAWRDDPVACLAEQVRAAVTPLLPAGVEPPSPPGDSLVEILRAWTERLDGDLLLILDQFEEYFLYHGQEDGPGAFAIEFPRTVNRQDLRASFLLSLREDALAQLDRFKGRIPNLFDNYLRIRHLDREAAREAIERPIARFNELRGEGAQPVSIEPALVEEVLDQVQSGRVLLGEVGQGGIGVSASSGDGGAQIETPYLQLVITRLWEEEMQAGSRVLQLSTLQELGGAKRIVRTHLDKVMDALSPQEQEAAARIFHHLVTPGGTKIAHTTSDLAAYTELGESELEPVLRTLPRGDVRILRSADSRYEIFHDVLAPAVLDWRRRYLERRQLEEIRRQEQEQQERKRNRLRRALIVTVLVGISALSGVTVFALYESRRAQSALERYVRTSEGFAEFVSAVAAEDSLVLERVLASIDTVAIIEVEPLVYIQFRGAVSRGLLEELRAELNQAGFPAPGTERNQYNFASHVSYFHEEDRGLADTLALKTQEFFGQRGCPLELPLRHLPQARSRVRRGQVEIWVHTNCPR